MNLPIFIIKYYNFKVKIVIYTFKVILIFINFVKDKFLKILIYHFYLHLYLD